MDGLLLRVAVLVLMFAVSPIWARDEIKVYRVPKERPSAQSLPAGHPQVSGAEAAPEPSLKWKTPEGWNEVPPGEMRKASFNVKGADGKQADVSVIPLGGMAGGDAANVNRWRSQVALPALPPDELKRTAEPVTVGGQPGELFDVSGTNTSSGEPTRILGVIQHRDGKAWFYKMTGDDQLVAQQKPAFVEFLKSIEFTAGEMALPASHPPIGAASSAAAQPSAGEVTTEGQPKWQTPTGWKPMPGGQFLVAKFVISGDGGAQASVNVSQSAGDGGGLAGNVNRWRGQLKLSPLAGDELTKAVKPLKLPDGEASLVEMSGTEARSGQPAKLIGAIVPQGGQTWFYKLMGDAKIVESQQAAFLEFLRSAKY